jgi:GAF domain-containing protein
MLDRIRRVLAAPIFENNEEKTRVASMLNTIVVATLVLSMTFAIATPLISPNPGFSLVFTGALILPQLGALYLMRRGRVQLAATLLSSMLWGIITLSAATAGGLRSTSFGIYILVILVAGLLLGLRAAVVFIGLSVVSGLGMVYAETKGFLPEPLISNTPSSTLTVQIVSFAAAVALLYLATRSINQALKRARRYAAEVEEQREHLEEIVKERTRGLERRARYLETTAEVARDASAVLDMRELLDRVSTLISERFGFYHTGLFLVDPTGEWAVLRAAASGGGRRMLARGHRLRVGQGGQQTSDGIVGYVTSRGESRIALDVGTDAVLFDNPDLPDTRSEMALPLRAGDEVIGALDVQSTEPAAFSDEDVVVLQTLADQVAVAISNARLLQQVEASLEMERRAYGELSREAWRALIHAQPDIGFIRGRQGISPTGDLWRPAMKKAVRSGERASDDENKGSLAVPIKVRGHVIGVIDARKREDKADIDHASADIDHASADIDHASADIDRASGEWSPQEIALLETLTDRLGVTLESARLHQDTQRHAAREQMASEITTRMRETLDLKTVLKTTVQEIRQTLDLPEVVVRLVPRPASRPENGARKQEARSRKQGGAGGSYA